MSVSTITERMIDYAPCRYNGSRLWFRGPVRPLRQPYVACLGGCAMYGRYLTDPLPDLLRTRIAHQVVNLGVENAGVDAYLNDPGALLTASKARVAVVQLSDSHNTSNRYYAVHPRRNDRFLKASATLQTLYPEMDFTEVHFTRHLLSRLHDICPERFELIATEVRKAWQSRMRNLISHLRGEVVLFWFAPHPLAENAVSESPVDLFIDRTTVEWLRVHARTIVEVVTGDWETDRSKMLVSGLETERLRHLAGPVAHRQAAEALTLAIRPMLQ